MKIAVTYDNGTIFQHFGKTEYFKVYEVENGQVISSEVIGSNGTGHGALAGLLAGQGIDVLICGGIGGGAQNASLISFFQDFISLCLLPSGFLTVSAPPAPCGRMQSGRFQGYPPPP